MALKDFSLDAWQHPDENVVFIRLQHNVENGSSIGSQGSSLAEALVNLGNSLKKGRHDALIDPIWKDPIVRGN